VSAGNFSIKRILYCIVFVFASYCISLGPQRVGAQCPLTSSLCEIPGYWDWPLRYPGLPSVLVSIAISSVASHTSVFFHSLFTCHWTSFVFLLNDRRICTHSIKPSLIHFFGEFPGLGLALVPDVVVPGEEHGPMGCA